MEHQKNKVQSIEWDLTWNVCKSETKESLGTGEHPLFITSDPIPCIAVI